MDAPRGRQGRWSSHGFTPARKVVLGFILVRVSSLRRAEGSSGSVWFAWVHSGATSDRRVHSGTCAFTRAHLGVVRIRVGSPRCSHWFTPVRLPVVGLIRVHFRSIGRAKGSSDSFGFAFVHLGAIRSRRVYSGSRGFTRVRLEVVSVIRLRVGSLERIWWSSGASGFA